MADLNALLFQVQEDDSEEEPTPDELFISDSLTPSERLHNYSSSDLIIHRLFILKDLENIIKELGFEETVQDAIPTLSKLADDIEPIVRTSAIEKTPLIAQYLVEQGGIEGYKHITGEIIPLIQKLLTDKNVQAQTAAHEALTHISDLLSATDLDNIILSFIFQLLGDVNEEDSRVEALALLKDLIHLFAQKGCAQNIRPKVSEYIFDSSFRVRKGCVEVIAELASHSSPEEISEYLLPMYLQLSVDKIWGVRKSCAIALPSISKATQPEQRKTKLLKTFEQLNEDVSRWVRTSVLESLGAFIASFIGDPEIPTILIDNFEKMASGDSDLILSCAFNFPAVVLTLGASKWQRLKPTYIKLTSDMQWKVRRTLSFSIHEIAKVIQKEATEEDLVPIFDLYLRDLDEVKIGVLTNYAKFLGNLNKDPRELFLQRIYELQSQTNSWRFRELLASQLQELCDICTAEEISKYLVPQSINFCKDGVNVVRITAIPGTCHILKSLKLKGKGSMFGDFATELNKIGTLSSYVGRQFYAQLCGELVNYIDPEDFKTIFLPLLSALSNDDVVNVRLSVAATLKKITSVGPLQHNTLVVSTLERMRRDPDQDVATNAS